MLQNWVAVYLMVIVKFVLIQGSGPVKGVQPAPARRPAREVRVVKSLIEVSDICASYRLVHPKNNKYFLKFLSWCCVVCDK